MSITSANQSHGLRNSLVVAVDQARGRFEVDKGPLSLGPCGQRFGLSILLRHPILWNPMLFASLICLCTTTVVPIV